MCYKQEAQELLNNISIAWLRDVCLFALLTEARRTEIISMTWDKIDFQNKITIVSNDIAKNGKARSLLLNEEAIRLLQDRQLKSAILKIFIFMTCGILGQVGMFKTEPLYLPYKNWVAGRR